MSGDYIPVRFFVLFGDYQNSRRFANFTVCYGMYNPLVNGLHTFVLELILELQLDFQNDFIHGREAFEYQGLGFKVLGKVYAP